MEDIELQVCDNNNSMFDINNNIMRHHAPHLEYAHTWLLFSDLVKIIPIIIPILLLTDSRWYNGQASPAATLSDPADPANPPDNYISTLGFLQQT